MSKLTDKMIAKAKCQEDLGLGKATMYRLDQLQEQGLVQLDKLPYSIRVLLECVLRNYDGQLVTRDNVESVMNWPQGVNEADVPYMPSRLVLQDFTGVPLIVDLATMRDAIKKEGGDPEKINPLVPTDLVVDHSVQVDFFGAANAFTQNLQKEYERNLERYKLIKWAQQSFRNFRVVPPGSGIIHQVNLEYLSPVVSVREFKNEMTAIPDAIVGTDSHTTMINGLGVIGWGVGGIEAEAVMLGQPYYMLLPEVIGVKLTGELKEGVTATDLVLTITELLRKTGVVDKFVEYFGPGLDKLALTDRATLANMSPEYGATMGFFPVDEVTLAYMQMSGRDPKQIAFVEKYCKAQKLFREKNSPDPTYTKVIELDMNTVEPSLSGPANPEERVSIPGLKARSVDAVNAYIKNRKSSDPAKTAEVQKQLSVPVNLGKETTDLRDGDVVIAAITSCTNTSNPSVMIGSGLMAQKAVAKGLKVKPYVKTSLAPGSKVVTQYLKNLGLMPALESLGFHLAAYGCTTCIGNSGDLPKPVENAVKQHDLYVTSVLSGNRNFSGRVHQLVRGNFLASPMLVVAYAIAGTTNIDLTTEPLGTGKDGKPVFLKDIWPSQQEIRAAVESGVKPDIFKKEYSTILQGDDTWQQLPTKKSTLFDWEANSTYVRKPPYFDNYSRTPKTLQNIQKARALLVLGDKISTDHISPAGAIDKASPAGQYLQERGVKVDDFNTYGARRGNHEVMVRGTFANVRIKNQLADNKEGWWTKYLPTNQVTSIFDASLQYQKEKTPLVVLGGAQYGQGSSRDWAAKGPYLLGIQAVIVKDFERIHRSNLVGMGILPMLFEKGKGWKELGLDGSENFEIVGLSEGLVPKKQVGVIATKGDKKIEFSVTVRLNTPVEIEYYRAGGILQFVVSKILAAGK